MDIPHIKPTRPYDTVILDIADYVTRQHDFQGEAFDTARWCLLDSLGCGLLALRYSACTQMMGPVVPGAIMLNGARVPGTHWQLEPVKAAWTQMRPATGLPAALR